MVEGSVTTVIISEIQRTIITIFKEAALDQQADYSNFTQMTTW